MASDSNAQESENAYHFYEELYQEQEKRPKIPTNRTKLATKVDKIDLEKLKRQRNFSVGFFLVSLAGFGIGISVIFGVPPTEGAANVDTKSNSTFYFNPIMESIGKQVNSLHQVW